MCLQTKRQFTASAGPNDKFVVPVGGVASNPAIGIVRNRLNLTTKDLTAIFQPVIDEIIQLVRNQVAAAAQEAKIKAILLVGGFGASPYLKEKLREAMGSHIKILQPPYAWQAVVGGAVLKGLANNSPESATVQVASRMAKYSYGVHLNTPFRPESHQHLESTKYWDNPEAIWRVWRMFWFTKKVPSGNWTLLSRVLTSG